MFNLILQRDEGFGLICGFFVAAVTFLLVYDTSHECAEAFLDLSFRGRGKFQPKWIFEILKWGMGFVGNFGFSVLMGLISAWLLMVIRANEYQHPVTRVYTPKMPPEIWFGIAVFIGILIYVSIIRIITRYLDAAVWQKVSEYRAAGLLITAVVAMYFGIPVWVAIAIFLSQFAFVVGMAVETAVIIAVGILLIVFLLRLDNWHTGL